MWRVTQRDANSHNFVMIMCVTIAKPLSITANKHWNCIILPVLQTLIQATQIHVASFERMRKASGFLQALLIHHKTKSLHPATYHVCAILDLKNEQEWNEVSPPLGTNPLFSLFLDANLSTKTPKLLCFRYICIFSTRHFFSFLQWNGCKLNIAWQLVSKYKQGNPWQLALLKSSDKGCSPK